jgi:large subunit ribosomal protein L24
MMQTNRRSKKIRKGDHVLAIAGNEKGRYGVVLACNGDKVVVQGLNIRKKHAKKVSAAARTGIIDIEAPIHISNLRLCSEKGEPLKVKVRTDADGERELYYVSEGKEMTYRSMKSGRE